MPKSVFLMLMRNERLAGFRAHFEEETQLLTIRRDGEVVARGDLETAQGRAAIEGFFAENFASELKGSPKVVSSLGHSFSDVAKKLSRSSTSVASRRSRLWSARRCIPCASAPTSMSGVVQLSRIDHVISDIGEESISQFWARAALGAATAKAARTAA
jgi:hypothetical protein